MHSWKLPCHPESVPATVGEADNVPIVTNLYNSSEAVARTTDEIMQCNISLTINVSTKDRGNEVPQDAAYLYHPFDSVSTIV